jgi:hypothetical protein
MTFIHIYSVHIYYGLPNFTIAPNYNYFHSQQQLLQPYLLYQSIHINFIQPIQTILFVCRIVYNTKQIIKHDILILFVLFCLYYMI